MKASNWRAGHPPVARRAAFWEHGLNDAPLIVIEFIPHGSRLQFGALNHGRRAATNRGSVCPQLPANRTLHGHHKATRMTQSRHPCVLAYARTILVTSLVGPPLTVSRPTNLRVSAIV